MRVLAAPSSLARDRRPKEVQSCLPLESLLAGAHCGTEAHHIGQGCLQHLLTTIELVWKPTFYKPILIVTKIWFWLPYFYMTKILQSNFDSQKSPTKWAKEWVSMCQPLQSAYLQWSAHVKSWSWKWWVLDGGQSCGDQKSLLLVNGGWWSLVVIYGG